MRRLSATTLLIGGLLLLLLAAGCENGDRRLLGNEVDDPQYRRGQQLLKQGRNQEALGAFLKVIEKRGDDAPESHLEAGLLYQQYLRDPLAAIYHFRKYTELQPGSRQVDLVRQRISAAMRDFARSLPAQPLDNQNARLDLLGRIDELQKENLQLKEQIAASSATATGGTRRPLDPPRDEPAAPVVVARSSATRRSAAAGPGPAIRPAPLARPPASPAAPPPAAGRRHVVAPGDTLYKIAQRYYGSGAKWTEILQANRDVLKNENAVKVGMELRIP
jgi:tetratricopeptide (TPR) repeat protein